MAQFPTMPYSSVSGGTKKSRPEKKRDFFHKAIDVLTTPQQAIVGMAEEAQARKLGVPPTSMVDAAKRGMREDYEFSKVMGPGIKATAANIVLDPVNLIPFSGYTKLAKAGTGVVRGAAVKTISKSPALKKAADELGQLVIKDYRAKHMIGFPELADFRLDHAKKMRELLAENVDPRTKEVMKLVPKYADRKRLFRLAEEPLNGNSPEWANWKAKVEALSPDEQKALQIGREFFSEQADLKIKNGLIETLAAEGVEHRQGVTYAPRYLNTPDEAATAIRAEIDASKAALPTDPKALSRAQRRITRLEQQAQEYESMGSNTLRERLVRSAGKVQKPGFTKQRKLGPLSSIGHLADMFDQDIARVMERERVDVAKALADKEYLDNAARFLKGSGFTKTADEVKGLHEWGPLSDKFAGLKGTYVPKELGKEVNQVIEKMADPVFAPTVFGAFRKLTQMWKSVTLFYAPEFYSRQFVSNIALNRLAGMGLRDMQHDWTSLKYVKKFMFDRAAPDPNAEVINGIREPEFYKLLVREGALGHGLVGEVDELLKVPTPGRNKFVRGMEIMARDNPVVTRGIKAANAIDGQSKIAHILWRLSEGDTPAQAGASMRKFLYDPDFLLTPFEKKYLRDAAAPFYGWVKFNLPLQLEMLAYYPHRYALQARTFREVENALGGPDLEEEFLPDWMQDSSKMRVAWNDKTKTWDVLFLASWYPLAEIEKLSPVEGRMAREVWNMVTPLAKEPVEWVSGYDLYSFQPIERFPGERGDVLKIPMRKRLEAAIKFLRPINIADKTMEAYAREVAGTREGARVQSALRQLSIGRVYHVNQEQIKKQWNGRMEFRIRELKGIRNYYKKKGDEVNQDRVEDTIRQLEDNLKALK